MFLSIFCGVCDATFKKFSEILRFPIDGNRKIRYNR